MLAALFPRLQDLAEHLTRAHVIHSSLSRGASNWI
jgi:hypothetical protein